MSDLVDRILAGAGKLDLADLVGGVVDAPPSSSKEPKQSDRYFSSQAILDRVLAMWGSIDLDPCWDPDPACIVQAKQVMDIRRGEDGLTLPWPSGSKVYLNPPYSNVGPWLVRAAQHAAAGGEVLALVPASTGTRAWLHSVWPFALVCCLIGRERFGRPSGCTGAGYFNKDSAILYYGPHRDRFSRIWAPHGELVSSVRLLPVPEDRV